ncbi:hypothetical protein B0H14DRAFT_2593865 [Mycena olivaceomarginata]|nr:hypothetical protein B0H14DRAFT_2593865 [Mycena olivaceomarginata]
MAAGGPAVPVVAVGPRLEVEEQRGAMTMKNRAQNRSLLTKNAILTRKDDSDDEDDEGETEIDSFNGHRWEARRNLQFQVIWTDSDVTWESLANVNDCAAMEDYLAHRDVDDPLLLPKRKYLIKTTLRASNE